MGFIKRIKLRQKLFGRVKKGQIEEDLNFVVTVTDSAIKQMGERLLKRLELCSAT